MERGAGAASACGCNLSDPERCNVRAALSALTFSGRCDSTTHKRPENAGRHALTVLSTSATNALILLIICQALRIPRVTAKRAAQLAGIKIMHFAFTVRFGRTFLTVDDLGLHAVLGGREIAWTREFGWIVD